MIISLENVFKYYGADCILRNVCATINDKDRIGLVGANGEGKTTLLNVLTGELDYEEGTVSLRNSTAYPKASPIAPPTRLPLILSRFTSVSFTLSRASATSSASSSR